MPICVIPVGGLTASYLAGIGLAVEVAGTEHVGADVGTIHLRAATFVVSNKGDQCLAQGARIVAHICGVLHFQGRQVCCLSSPCPNAHWWELLSTHSHPCGPSLQSDTCVQKGRSCLPQAGRWAEQTGSGQHSVLPSSSAGSRLGGREARGQPGQ